MISREQNDALTKTGPGTIMGELFRRYWIPALHDVGAARARLPAGAREAARRAPGRVPRHAEDRIGLIDEFCAHRGVSLWFGRNEECGLRCPYHGWKYDITGQCVDLPSEGEDGPMRKRMKLKSYPCIEAGGAHLDLHGPAGAQARAARARVGAACRPSGASCPSACRNATICRRSKAASIPRT